MTRAIDTIIDDFDLLDDWEDKYRYVIELGRELPDMDDSEKTAANKVNGCVSQVWVVAEPGEGETLHFRGDSDAHIVRGLVAIMISALSGKPSHDIVAFDAEALFKRIGLDSHLTPQRANGLRSMVERMKAEAAGMAAA
ncbi:MAG: SufE family protein [Roseitalea sp.]|jgi:cysteine desulfuration protein SufE|uniref:SufE family protein n=1 Tax=Oceaniradius stylonematis TaxID=2184161 RepID=A0A3A8A8N6_9HYPH|nr:SufE family protein [Oceaniradius stylonematis]MBO6554579.1 SufE family protein [Roseitalea sp.]MBO6953622.1 SufE family protein [Rhizobiaceae bacterium]MBO6593949.1 SufE family protein [Roseitalea sp.]MBO6601366.1 SufE family protein [Roseitalea sp.]MBO6612862.1 SufE family protein [Roseitalea sp.]